MGCLGIELRFSGRASSARHCRATSPAPALTFKNKRSLHLRATLTSYSWIIYYIKNMRESSKLRYDVVFFLFYDSCHRMLGPSVTEALHFRITPGRYSLVAWEAEATP